MYLALDDNSDDDENLQYVYQCTSNYAKYRLLSQLTFMNTF